MAGRAEQYARMLTRAVARLHSRASATAALAATALYACVYVALILQPVWHRRVLGPSPPADLSGTDTADASPHVYERVFAHQFTDYPLWTRVHVLCGAAWLVLGAAQLSWPRTHVVVGYAYMAVALSALLTSFYMNNRAREHYLPWWTWLIQVVWACYALWHWLRALLCARRGDMAAHKAHVLETFGMALVSVFQRVLIVASAAVVGPRDTMHSVQAYTRVFTVCGVCALALGHLTASYLRRRM